MPLSDYNIQFTVHTKSTEVPPSYFQQASKFIFGGKIVPLTKESHELEFSVTNKVGVQILNKNVHGLVGKEISQEKRNFIPIALRDPENGILNENEIIYVDMNELAHQLLLSDNEVSRLQNLTSSAKSEDMAALRARTRLDTLLYVKAKEEQAIRVLVPTLKQKLAQPIEESVSKAANQCVSESPRLNDKTLEKIGKSEAFQRQRTSGSNTLQSAHDLQRTQSHANWLKADEFVRDLAIKQEPLSIETICIINRILRQDIEGEEEEAGVLRDKLVSSGGLNGLEYPPPQILAKEMQNLIDWINVKVKECREGKANPIEVAALANQRAVSFHPFGDANGRTCRLIMDYVLQTCGLPPPVLGNDVKWALFGDQDVPDTEAASKTPTKAVQAVTEAVKKSYELLETEKK